MKVTTVGIDLAKNVFQLHGVNELGKTVFKKQLWRDQMAEFFVNLPACLIGMEACGGSHYWARKLQGFGHTVKLMAPQFVKPYVKTNKNDAADAEAICEAVASKGLNGLVRLGKLAIFDSGAVMQSDLAETCSVWRMVTPSPAIHGFSLRKLMNGLLDTAFLSASSRCSRTVCQGTSAKAVTPRKRPVTPDGFLLRHSVV